MLQIAKITLFVLGSLLAAQAAAAGDKPGKTVFNPKRACLVALEKAAAKGNGGAAKTLAIYFGSHSRNPGLAFTYLNDAIKAGVDVSDVPGQTISNIVDVCRRDPELRAVLVPPKPPASPKPIKKAKSPKAGQALDEAVPPRTNSRSGPGKKADAGESKNMSSAKKAPGQAHIGTPATRPEVKGEERRKARAAVKPRDGAKPAVIDTESPARLENPLALVPEYERQAAALESVGKIAEAIPFWEMAREAGSRQAAKRLYQIYCFGAGDVDADYVKAIGAAEQAKNLGVEVPPLPRK